MTVYFNGHDSATLTGNMMLCPCYQESEDSGACVSKQIAYSETESCPDVEMVKIPNRGVITCPAGDFITVAASDKDNKKDSEEKVLDAADVRCMDNEHLNLFFQYGQQDTFDGSKPCFRSKLTRTDLEAWDYSKDPLILVTPCKAEPGGCQEPSHRFSFLVVDDKAGNELTEGPAKDNKYPMLERKFMAEVEFM